MRGVLTAPRDKDKRYRLMVLNTHLPWMLLEN